MESGEVAVRLLIELARHVMWLGFVVMHLALAVLLLAAAWAFHVTAEESLQFLMQLLQSHFWLVVAATGVSLLGVAKLYVRIWRRTYARLLGAKLFEPVLAAARAQQDATQSRP